MEDMFFPHQYKKALMNKTKNSTIRIGNEIGKYKVGKVIPTTFSKLLDFGIPKRSIKAIQKNEKISLNENVELIRFIVL